MSTAPMDLTDDERGAWEYASINAGYLADEEHEREHGRVVMATLQKLSDARAALRACKKAVDYTHERHGDGVRVLTDWRYIESVVDRAIATPAPVAVPARKFTGGGTRNTVPAPDPVQAAYARATEIAGQYAYGPIGKAIATAIEAAALRAGVKP